MLAFLAVVCGVLASAAVTVLPWACYHDRGWPGLRLLEPLGLQSHHVITKLFYLEANNRRHARKNDSFRNCGALDANHTLALSTHANLAGVPPPATA